MIDPRVIAIDTNLFTLILLHSWLHSMKQNAAQRQRRIGEVWGRQDAITVEQFDGLGTLFLSAKRRIVTQHVVAEALNSRVRKRFPEWFAALELTRKHQIDEVGCCVADLLPHNEFRKLMKDLGPTDAGLIYVAENEGATIISDDGHLRQCAEARLVHVIGLANLDYSPLRLNG